MAEVKKKEGLGAKVVQMTADGVKALQAAARPLVANDGVFDDKTPIVEFEPAPISDKDRKYSLHQKATGDFVIRNHHTKDLYVQQVVDKAAQKIIFKDVPLAQASRWSFRNVKVAVEAIKNSSPRVMKLEYFLCITKRTKKGVNHKLK